MSNSSVETYGGQGGSVQTQVTHGGALPFTGYDIGLAFAGAVFLFALGMALSRYGRRNA